MELAYMFTLAVCLFVCLCPINVKSAEPIGPEIFLATYMTPIFVEI